MVKVGKKDIKVSVVRKILSAFNKAVKEDAIKGIWRMKTPELAAQISKFTIAKNGNVKHRFKAKGWEYPITEDMKSKGRVGKSKPKKQSKKAKADESAGMKGQTKKTKSKTAKGEENFTGKKGNVSKSKGKDVKAENPNVDYSKKKKGTKADVAAAIDAMEAKEGKAKKKTAYREWLSKQLKSGKKMKELTGKWKKSKEYKAEQKKKKKK